MSSRIDPTRLAAYVDGQLSSRETSDLEKHLARSPEDRQVVEDLREMNARLATAFEAPLRAPLPPAMRKRLAGSGQRRQVRTTWRVAAGSALAACIALAAGYFAGTSWQETVPGLGAGELARTSALNDLLESGRDGNATSFGGGTATLSTTFIDGRGEPCREFDWSGDNGVSSSQGIACRRGQRWVVEISVSRPDPVAETSDAYVPATGASEEIMAVALDDLNAGPVLGPDEVDLLISSGWTPP